MKKLLSCLAVSALALSLSAPLYAQQAAPMAAAAKPGMKEEGKERHPEINHAIHALENAKGDLQKAAHDYDGHRTKALEHVDAALKELHEALKSDKQ